MLLELNTPLTTGVGAGEATRTPGLSQGATIMADGVSSGQFGNGKAVVWVSVPLSLW